MIKSILIQLWNRKRSNAWLVVELLLVFCLTWYIVDYFFVYYYNKSLPDYRNTDHAWYIYIDEYKSEQPNFFYPGRPTFPAHPYHKEEEGSGEAREANYRRIIQLVRDYPGVEVVGITFGGGPPRGGRSGITFHNAEDTTLYTSGQPVAIYPQADFFRVFSYTKDKGKTPVSVQDFDWTNGIVLSELANEAIFPDKSGTKKEVMQPGENVLSVAGVIDDVKHADYEPPSSAFYYSQPLDSTTIEYAQLTIRTNTSISDVRFQEDFKRDMTKALRIGNFYLRDIYSYKKIIANDDVQWGLKNDIDIRTYLMGFFLINILLCLLGTFWYRISVRKEEIGIRKAVGANNRNILTSFLLEGLCLLTIALIPAMIIEYQFVQAGLIRTLSNSIVFNPAYHMTDRVFFRFFMTNGITWLIMAAVVIVSILLPAVSASRIAAVDALRDE